MAGSTIGLFATRAFQIIFAAVVLGLSVKFSQDLSYYMKVCKASTHHDKQCDVYGNLPSTVDFSAFAGAFGLLDALVGLVAAFISAIPWIAVVALDALAAIFFLAGGISLAVIRTKERFSLFCSNDNNDNDPRNDCTKWSADAAFLFLGFIASLLAIGMVFLCKRSGTRHSKV